MVKKFVLKQQWKNRGCQVEIQSVTVGYPWAIGAGFGCSGGDDTAYRSSTDGRGKYSAQFNSDAVINVQGHRVLRRVRLRDPGEGHHPHPPPDERRHQEPHQVSADFSVVLPG